MDILIIAVVARHLLINGPRPPAAMLLVAGLGTYLLADLVNVRETFLGTYSAADPVNAGWLAGYTLAAAAVLHPSMTRIGATDEEMRPVSRARGLLLVGATIAPAIVIVTSDGWGWGDRIVLGVASACLATLVLIRLFGALRDQQRLRAWMTYQAHHDPLTGLANRVLFGDQLATALRVSPTGVGLLYLDLDDFKSVNDQFGHEAGDALLRTVADRLRATLRIADDIARLGGDEFAVIVTPADRPEVVEGVGRRISAALVPVATVDSTSIRLGASIGIAWSRPGGVSAGELLRRADVAMYAAKHSGQGAAIYGAELENPVRQGLAAGQGGRSDHELTGSLRQFLAPEG